MDTAQSQPTIKFNCDQCNFEFDDEQHLKEHVDSTHSTHNCDKCLHYTNNSAALEKHKRQMHGFRCHLCEHTATTLSNLKDHAKTQHYKCNDCEYYATHLKEIIRHRTTMHSPAVSCEECNSKYRTTEELQQHIRSIHTNNHMTAQFNCNLRGEETQTSEN